MANQFQKIKPARIIALFLLLLFSIFGGVIAQTEISEKPARGKDAWPLKIKEDLNVALIGTYGEYRSDGKLRGGGHYHLAIDIHSNKGESVFNNADGILLECIKIHNRAGYRIIIGDINTLEGREFTHVDPVRKILRLEPGKSLIKKGELIGHICDYRNDGDLWNDHLHYAYVRIKRPVNKEGDALNVIEGIGNPLGRLEITPEICKILRDAPPQMVEQIIFIPDEGRKGDFEDDFIYGNVDIVVHAFDRMGRSEGLGRNSPAPYEFQWRIIEPAGYETEGGILKMDGRIPLIRPQYHANYIENESWIGDFQIIVTNGMVTNGYWSTRESKSYPGTQARSSDDALFPDGDYTIEVVIREHPALGIPPHESTFTVKTTINNFND